MKHLPFGLFLGRPAFAAVCFASSLPVRETLIKMEIVGERDRNILQHQLEVHALTSRWCQPFFDLDERCKGTVALYAPVEALVFEVGQRVHYLVRTEVRDQIETGRFLRVTPHCVILAVPDTEGGGEDIEISLHPSRVHSTHAEAEYAMFAVWAEAGPRKSA